MQNLKITPLTREKMMRPVGIGKLLLSGMLILVALFTIAAADKYKAGTSAKISIEKLIEHLAGR